MVFIKKLYIMENMIKNRILSFCVILFVYFVAVAGGTLAYLVFFAMDLQWPLLIGATVNTLMFLFISIPMADKRQSRKPGFTEYKKETRIL